MGEKDNKEAILQVVGAVIFSILICLLIYYLINPEWVGNVSNFLQIAGTAFAFIAWNNTRKLIEKRKRARVEVKSKDIILTISLSADNEQSVKKYINGSKNNLKKLEAIKVSGSKSGELSNPDNKYMALVKPNELSGALSIRRIQDMPTEESSIKDYINELSRVSKVTFAR